MVALEEMFYQFFRQNKSLYPIYLPLLGLEVVLKYILRSVYSFLYCVYRGIKFITFDAFLYMYHIITGNFNIGTKKEDAKTTITNQELLKKQQEQHEKWLAFYNKLWFVKSQNKKLAMMKEKLQVELQSTGAIRSKTPIVYQFIGRNPRGKVEKGTVSGYSKLDVNTFLVQEGYEIYDIKSNKTIDFLYGQTSLFATKMSTKDLLFWLTQLSTYLKSGITLTEAVKILNNQMAKKKHYRRSFKSIVYELMMGSSFSEALEKQGNMFPPLLINMVKAAEATGEIEETLEDMANYYEELEKTRKEMLSAITYPTVIMIFAIGVITFLMVFVIPQFIEIYDQANAQLSGITLLVISVSNYIQKNGITLILILTLAIAVFVFLYKKIKALRKAVQTLLMHLPLIGNIIIYNELTIFTKTFASLLSNNVFITDSIEILSKITNNEIYKEIMFNTINNVINGEKISLAFENHWAVPEVAYYMIVTGESTGELATMMQKVSSFYQQQHKAIISNLKSFIEPVLIAFLAVVVGVVIISVVMPMFGLMSTIQ